MLYIQKYRVAIKGSLNDKAGMFYIKTLEIEPEPDFQSFIFTDYYKEVILSGSLNLSAIYFIP